VDKKTAEKAMRWLMEQGYVRSVGTSRSAFGKMAHVLMASSEMPEKYARRTRKEWAIFRQEQRDAEAIARYEYEQAEQSGELLEATAQYEYEQAEARGDYDNIDLWEPGDSEPDFEPELMDDEPLDPEILATIEAAEGEVIV